MFNLWVDYPNEQEEELSSRRRPVTSAESAKV